MNLISLARLVVPVFLGYLFVKLLKWAICIHVLAFLLDVLFSTTIWIGKFVSEMFALDIRIFNKFVEYCGWAGVPLLLFGILVSVLVILLSSFKIDGGGVFFIRTRRRRNSRDDY